MGGRSGDGTSGCVARVSYLDDATRDFGLEAAYHVERTLLRYLTSWTDSEGQKSAAFLINQRYLKTIAIVLNAAFEVLTFVPISCLKDYSCILDKYFDQKSVCRPIWDEPLIKKAFIGQFEMNIYTRKAFIVQFEMNILTRKASVGPLCRIDSHQLH